jgi:hypothetical protein
MSFHPSYLTCRDWYDKYERYNELKMDTAHFYNTLVSSLSGIKNGFLRSVTWAGGGNINYHGNIE